MKRLKEKDFDGIIYLAGDSSMDNKYWINNRFKESINGYQDILSKMLPDICYHMNKVL